MGQLLKINLLILCFLTTELSAQVGFRFFEVDRVRDEANNALNLGVQYSCSGCETPDDFYKQLEPEGYKYFSCHGNRRYQLDDLQKKVLKKTAQYTGISEIILACLLFIESRFNHRAVSSVGAVGIGQFTPATLRTLSRYHRRPSDKALSACREKRSLSEEEVLYCDALEKRVAASKDFKVFSSFLSDELPSGIKFIASYKHSSVALSGYYMKFILDTVIKDSIGLDFQKYEGQEQIDVIKMALASYNAGPARVKRLLNRLGPGKEIKDYVAVVRGISRETKGHMDGIEDCVKKGSYAGPTEHERNLNKVCD